MPAMTYNIRWPDGLESNCYSPSSIVREYLQVGMSYRVEEFLQRIRAATEIASERVRAKFGYACSRARDQLRQIEERAARFAADTVLEVTVLSFEEHPQELSSRTPIPPQDDRAAADVLVGAGPPASHEVIVEI